MWLDGKKHMLRWGEASLKYHVWKYVHMFGEETLHYGPSRRYHIRLELRDPGFT